MKERDNRYNRVGRWLLICCITAGINHPLNTWAHGGRTNAEGCHNNRQTGKYHCHNEGSTSKSTPRPSAGISEDACNDSYCASIGGQRETRHYYTYPGGRSYVIADCETAGKVIEGGLDKRSSLDSIQQALFFSVLSGKRGEVVIYDTDGKQGNYEYRIETAAARAGVLYSNPSCQ